MSFSEFLSENPFINEAFNTQFKITKIEKEYNVKLFYFDVNNKKYRIFVENIDNHLHVGFERYFDNKEIWDIDGTSKDLKQKEVLTLFGTIKSIILQYKFVSISVSTREYKKHGLYRRMMDKLAQELGEDYIVGTNDIYIFIRNKNNDTFSPKMLKFKK